MQAVIPVLQDLLGAANPFELYFEVVETDSNESRFSHLKVFWLSFLLMDAVWEGHNEVIKESHVFTIFYQLADYVRRFEPRDFRYGA